MPVEWENHPVNKTERILRWQPRADIQMGMSRPGHLASKALILENANNVALSTGEIYKEANGKVWSSLRPEDIQNRHEGIWGNVDGVLNDYVKACLQSSVETPVTVLEPDYSMETTLQHMEVIAQQAGRLSQRAGGRELDNHFFSVSRGLLGIRNAIVEPTSPQAEALLAGAVESYGKNVVDIYVDTVGALRQRR